MIRVRISDKIYGASPKSVSEKAYVAFFYEDDLQTKMDL